MGWEIPRLIQAVKLNWLLLVPSLELIEASQVACLRGFRKLSSSHSYGKAALGAHKFGGAESLGISKADQTALTRLMVSQVWHQPASSVALQEEDSEKGQCPLLPPLTDTSASSSMPLVPFKVPPWRWSSEGVSLSR